MDTTTESDGSLLRRFRTHNDEQAFAALLRRHGRLVVGTARSVTGATGAADDIAQATFLMLVRKAGQLEAAVSIAGWLCHVAVCLARNERRNELRRQARERAATMNAIDTEAPATVAAGTVAALYEELGRLAEKYRQPVVLHHLEGLSYEAAAARCGCNDKTFSTRLTRAREQLRQRLLARGVTLGADGIAGALEESATTAVLPPALLAATCQAASLLAAGKTLTGTGLVSAKVASLTKSAVKMLFWAKVKTVALATAASLAVVAGGGLAVHQALAHLARVTPPSTVAVADAAGLRKLSPADAWLRELLARAEAGSWEALDLKRGTIIGDSGVWRTDLRAEPAGWRVWQTNPDGGKTMVLLDEARWKRGVVVGRVMMLPAGTLPPALAIPEQASNAVWQTMQGELRDDGKGGPPKGALLALYKSPYSLSLLGCLFADLQTPGVWYRYAVYFDADAKDGAFVAWITWPVDSAGPPPAAQWSSGRGDFTNLSGNAVGVMLMTKGVSALWQGVKVVPLGADMPLPPPGVAGR